MTATAEEIVPGGPLQVVKGRGYYVDTETKERYTRVTTILDVLDMPLAYWAAGRVAKAAFDNLPRMTKASRDETATEGMIKWLTGVPNREMTERGDFGTAVHKAAQARVLGDTPPRSIKYAAGVRDCLNHFDRFIDEWQFTYTASEMTVLSRTHGYGGTLDGLGTSPLVAKRLGTDPAVPIVIDIKTGGELDKKGIYPKVGLQESAYGHAEFAQSPTGVRVRMPKVAAKGLALHLRPEGYRLIEVDAGDEVFAQFLGILGVYRGWSTGIAKRVLGKKPLELPRGGGR